MRDLKQDKGYRHIMAAQAGFVHPKNGHVYFATIERDQLPYKLAVRRFLPDQGRMQLVQSWDAKFGASAPEAAVVIGMSGAMYVATSLVVDGSVYDGSFVTIQHIDEPWTTGDNGLDADARQRIDTISRTVAGLVRYLSATL